MTMTAAEIVVVDPAELATRPPFSDLFAIDPNVRAAIDWSMREYGYDPSKPINVWRQENVVVDGHTRRLAALAAGLSDVPVCYHDFASEDDALAYAIANQRDRRNLTNADILRCIEAVDKRRAKGGDRKSETARSIPSRDGIDSAAETAKVVGVSRATVERARVILDHAATEPDVKDDVLAGKKSIKGAAREIGDRKRKKAADYVPVVPEAVVSYDPPPPVSGVVAVSDSDRAWLESHPLRAWVVARRFDEDALIYRRFSRELGGIRADLQRLIGLRSDEHESVLYRALLKVSPLPPINTWTVCHKCEGKGCKACRQGGYTIPGF